MRGRQGKQEREAKIEERKEKAKERYQDRDRVSPERGCPSAECVRVKEKHTLGNREDQQKFSVVTDITQRRCLIIYVSSWMHLYLVQFFSLTVTAVLMW